MTRFLLATDSVHTTAAACDYLADRMAEGDAVTVLTVAAGESDPRDGDDALNVATVRLSAQATVETARADGDPVDGILEAAADGGADEIVIGARSGALGAEAGLGTTARAVLARTNVPVVVLPLR